MKDTKIALVQMESVLNDKSSNLKKILDYIKEAWENHVDIICFPEASINGYSKNSKPIGEEEKRELSEVFREISAKYKMTILTGFIEANGDDLPYITHMINTPDGRVDYYRKSHLGRSEIGYFSKGDMIPVFRTPTAIIGIQLCWESHFPELSTIMALKNVEIIFTPFASPLKGEGRKDIWMKYLPARAYDNAVFLGACNSKGTLALDPKGNLIKEDFSAGESILYVELDSKIIEKIKDNKNNDMSARHYISHRRPKLYSEISKSEKF